MDTAMIVAVSGGAGLVIGWFKDVVIPWRKMEKGGDKCGDHATRLALIEQTLTQYRDDLQKGSRLFEKILVDVVEIKGHLVVLLDRAKQHRKTDEA